MGVIARGIKTPIIKAGDNLVEIITNSLLNDMNEKKYELNDKDVIGITESIVSIANNDFVSMDDIVIDINNKFQGNSLGIVFPILSRNRFSMILDALSKAKKDITILLSFPNDEVGNPVLDESKLKDLNLDYTSVFNYDFFKETFSDFKHPWTNVNIVEYYKDVCNKNDAKVNFIFSNDPREIKKHTKNILVSDIHTRFKTSSLLKEEGFNVLRLDEILNNSVNGSRFNSKYGLLGANFSTKDKLKLFPNDSKELLNKIQENIYLKTKKKIELLVYGDGAFKDPVSSIWELADPVVSPSYTSGLEGSPNEVKLKYLAENKFKDLKGKELEEAIKNEKLLLKQNESNDSSLGTTPRRYVDLLGSLCDLVSGSGDRGTPVILIQNYFK